jgi:hypothetical protein
MEKYDPCGMEGNHVKLSVCRVEEILEERQLPVHSPTQNRGIKNRAPGFETRSPVLFFLTNEVMPC